MLKMGNKKRKQNIFLVILGTFLLAFAVEQFILPYNILSGGVAGLAVALEPFIHLDKTWFANGLVIVLLLIGWVILGKEFFLNTCLSSICYPIFTALTSMFARELTIDPVLASFYGGLLGGVGIGLVMRTGASTGGMDVPPLVIHKITGMRISLLVFITDAITVLLGLVAYDINAVLVGLVSVFSSSFAIRWVLNLEGDSAKSVQIISAHTQEISSAIGNQLDRGTTILEAKGGYTGEERKVILCVVSPKEYNELITFVHDIDPLAFIITTDATDMHGEGFSFPSRI